MSEMKVIDISKLGLVPHKYKEMQYRKTDNGVSGMSGLVEVTVTRMISTSHVNKEDALTLLEAGAEWAPTPKGKGGQPKWMTLFMNRRWYADEEPVNEIVFPDETTEPEAEDKSVTRKRGRPAGRSNR